MRYIYLAGPIDGMLLEEVTSWREKVINILPDLYIQTYSPGRCIDKENLSKEERLKSTYEIGVLAKQQGIMKK